MLLLQQKAPFTDWRAPGTLVKPEHEDVFKSAVWGYQLYTYLLLAAQVFDGTVAAILRAAQIRRFKIAGGITSHFEGMYRLFDRTLSERQPTPLPDDNPIALELKLALELLIVLPDSPFQMSREEFRQADAASLDFEDVDFALGRCLAHGKRRALEAFAPIFSIAQPNR